MSVCLFMGSTVAVCLFVGSTGYLEKVLHICIYSVTSQFFFLMNYVLKKNASSTLAYALLLCAGQMVPEHCYFNGLNAVCYRRKLQAENFIFNFYDKCCINVQITRLYKGKEYAEVEFMIGPIPADDGIGKEIITQVTTTMKTNQTFYTDSNGRDFIKRIRDYRADWALEVNQPVAGNYYPVNLGIYIEDGSMELSVLVDRSVGGSSLIDGQIELMLHRRLLHDDARGVGEVLNETVCISDECKGLTIQGKYFLRIDPIGEGAKWRRTAGQEIYSPLLLAFAEQDKDDWLGSHVPLFSGLDSSYTLPENVAIITLQEVDRGEVLLRLAHLYEVGEDKDLSNMASVELKKLFPNKKIIKVNEMSLSANQERSEMERRKLAWLVEGSAQETPKVTRGGPVDLATLVVELAPMEIRTFLLVVEVIQTFVA